MYLPCGQAFTDPAFMHSGQWLICRSRLSRRISAIAQAVSQGSRSHHLARSAKCGHEWDLSIASKRASVGSLVACILSSFISYAPDRLRYWPNRDRLPSSILAPCHGSGPPRPASWVSWSRTRRTSGRHRATLVSAHPAVSLRLLMTLLRVALGTPKTCLGSPGAITRLV